MHRLNEENRIECVNGMNTSVLHYISNSPKRFNVDDAIRISSDNDEHILDRLIEYLFSVSYDATEDEGWHMPDRIGGDHAHRYRGEIFADKFLGCMGEIALYKYIRDKLDDEIELPNMENPRGFRNSDIGDLVWHNKYFSVKTTRSTHNLLLLQKQHYCENGDYEPNVLRELHPRCFDYHVLCRLKNSNDENRDSIDIMRRHQDAITDEERMMLSDTIRNGNWLVDIPGFISQDTFVNRVISEEYVVQGSSDDRRSCFGRGAFSEVNKVDVDNYYVQAGDLNSIGKIKEITRTQGIVRYSNQEQHYAYLVDAGNVEYVVSTNTYNMTRENERLFSYANRLSLSFNVVRKNNRLYANDVKEVR